MIEVANKKLTKEEKEEKLFRINREVDELTRRVNLLKLEEKRIRELEAMSEND